MCTVRANELIRRTIMQDDHDPRMPAFLEDKDWATWLGETPASHNEVKAILKTMEGMNWKIAPEPKALKRAKQPQTAKPDPSPRLF
jgi:putative SOS response-associated peptidase YedK